MFERRVTDYDDIADRFDARYGVHPYDGIGEVLLNFLGDAPVAVLEVGCGTGHWLTTLARLTDEGGPRAKAVAERRVLAGIDPSGPMLSRAHAAAPLARLVRGRAEDLPWQDATFDRIFCVNALHHFTDRTRFFEEARRVLRPGGGLLTIGKDPHTGRDTWWVYEYFEETRAIDLARFARVRTLRGDLVLAGFDWADSLEAEHVEVVHPAVEALASGADGPLARWFTSQLTVLSDEEYERGLERIRAANAAADGDLQLVSDFKLYATIGWRQP